MTPIKQFTGEEIIADVLLEFPEAHEILAAHGIACAGCHINQYESLRDGIIAHYGEEMYMIVINDLNEAAQELKLQPGGKKETKDPVVTDNAKEKILAFQKDADQEGYGFRVEITGFGGNLSYFLDFEKNPDKGDKVVESNRIKIFCDPDSYRLLQNKVIDYKVTDDDEGFKFEKA